MMIWIELLLFACALTSVRTAAISGSSPCDIVKFEKELFKKSLVIDNQLFCDGKQGDFMAAGQLCLHTYKCPLDFSGKTRELTSICKSDGTWDVKTPSCEDMLAYAISILESIEKRSTKESHGTNFQVKKDSGFFVKPPMPSSEKLEGVKAFCKTSSMCDRINTAPSSADKCASIEKALTEDSAKEFFGKFCKICLKTDACRNSVTLL